MKRRLAMRDRLVWIVAVVAAAVVVYLVLPVWAVVVGLIVVVGVPLVLRRSRRRHARH